MSPDKIYGHKDSFKTQKVLVAAKMAKVDVQLAGVEAPSSKFPLGVVPAFEGDVDLFGAESIALHLLGTNNKNMPEIVQWLTWAEGSLLPNVLGYVLSAVSAANIGQKNTEAYKTELFAQLTIFNNVLLSRTYLVGERLSFADVSVALDLLPAFQHVLDSTAQKKLTNVTRWFKTVCAQPVVQEVVGAVQLCGNVASFDETKFKEFAAKFSKSVKKEEPKKDEKKEHKKPAPKASASHDDAEEDAAPKEEAKDPFATMPKGTFNMDNFKRVYSNEDTATKAIPFFWENFDKKNYSIWKCEYKYPEELGLIFMSCNLVGGMYQRLEKLNKNAFATMCLFGENNASTISGIWVWRGQELAFELSPDWQIDYESYTWTKLNPEDEATKKMINEYLLEEGDFGGKKFNQSKIFK